MHNTSIPFCIVLFVLFSCGASAQKQFRLAFYNCENLMDTLDNPHTRDDEFTPLGLKRWGSKKYYKKIDRLSKAIISLGEWDGVGVLALAEVENEKVVRDLLAYSPLKYAELEVIHFDSPDARGIDVALLYKPKTLTLLEAKPLRVDLPTGRTTRDILYARFLLGKTDTLAVLVCHWPSRWGGQVNSEPRRVFVANFMANWLAKNSSQTDKLVIVGDFNDGPRDKSVYETLGAHGKQDSSFLVNLMLPENGEAEIETHLHQGVWEALDQVIVSRALLVAKSGVGIKNQQVHVHKPGFLMHQGRNGQLQVHRSFRGARYEAGFSDHLPVYIDLYWK